MERETGNCKSVRNKYQLGKGGQRSVRVPGWMINLMQDESEGEGEGEVFCHLIVHGSSSAALSKLQSSYKKAPAPIFLQNPQTKQTSLGI